MIQKTIISPWLFDQDFPDLFYSNMKNYTPRIICLVDHTPFFYESVRKFHVFISGSLIMHR